MQLFNLFRCACELPCEKNGPHPNGVQLTPLGLVRRKNLNVRQKGFCLDISSCHCHQRIPIPGAIEPLFVHSGMRPKGDERLAKRWGRKKKQKIARHHGMRFMIELLDRERAHGTPPSQTPDRFTAAQTIWSIMVLSPRCWHEKFYHRFALHIFADRSARRQRRLHSTLCHYRHLHYPASLRTVANTSTPSLLQTARAYP